MHSRSFSLKMDQISAVVCPIHSSEGVDEPEVGATTPLIKNEMNEKNDRNDF